MPERTRATFRFYEELNDFLPVERRKRDFELAIDRARSVKDAIEAAGVPHTEVDLILVDGLSVDFRHILRGGERVAVYPMFERLDITPMLRLRPLPLRDPRFVADVHLGKLARHLRMAGFDTLFDAGRDDDAIVAVSAAQR
ncbi:MAG TPA: Mut7-C RNAse domain-containing protein, partial [Usitatibacter sp.]|nr:Mut7-C RNAse domain-containing protein [Usitatibacter sp.]